MNQHEWFLENIATHLTGGLGDDERERFDAHRAECPDCARELQMFEETEQKMTQLFADVIPPIDFEERLLGRLRHRGSHMRINPMARRAAIAAAAAIVLGGFGYVANQQIEHGGLDPTKVAINLRQVGTTTWFTKSEPKPSLAPSPANAPFADDLKKTAEEFRDGKNTWEMALNRGEVPTTASGKTETMEFGGGSNTALDWKDREKLRDQNNHDEGGQNVLYGDGHVASQQSPFVGVARDNIARFHGLADKNPAPFNADDSVLLPVDSGGNGDAKKIPASARLNSPEILGRPIQSESESTVAQSIKLGDGALSLQGQNAYRGPLQVNGPKGDVSEHGLPDMRKQIVSRNADSYDTSGATGKSANEFYFRPGQVALGPQAAADELNTAVRKPVEVGGKLELGVQASTPAAPTFDGPAIRQELSDSDKEKAPGVSVAAAEKSSSGFAFVAANTSPDNKPADIPAATTPPAQATAPAEPEHAPTSQEVIQRKVIRNGDIEFEVDSFDSATMTVTKIAIEEGGYIATTNSEKLPNGKVKGVIVVRIPPDHLDMLVLKLRALGDLKTQNLTAQDVTKQYTDTASELRASKAMEERLLDIIKKSQGQIKDLLAAEKELATWREKSEKLEGEIRYYDNLVSLSTLNISLFERDIKKAETAKETENFDMGVEAEDVERARNDAIKIVDDAKGRIVESELKRLDAGQFAAKIVAEIPPDASGPAIDRLKQIGQKIARLESTRSQTTINGEPPSSTTKMERGDTHLVLSLYNLANVAPRQTSNLNLAAEDVEQAYNTIVARIGDSTGARIVTSNLNRQTDQQTAGVVQFEVKREDADAVLADLRKTGEVTRLTVAENPDTNNVTSAKRGFNVQIVSMASMLPREVNNRALASADVDGSYQSILENLRKNKARIIVSRIEDAGNGQHTGYIDFETSRAKLDEIEKSLSTAGETYNRSVNAAADADNVTDAKVQFKLSISPATSLPARETNALAIEATDVDAAAQSFQNAAKSVGGRVIDSNFSKDEHGQTARLIVEVPYSAASQVVAQSKQLGTVRGSQQSTNPQAPSGELARARIELTLATPDVLVAPEHGVLATLRNGLSTSFAGLMWSLQLIVIGLCLVAPWIVLIWLGVKLLKRTRRKPVVT